MTNRRGHFFGMGWLILAVALLSSPVEASFWRKCQVPMATIARERQIAWGEQTLKPLTADEQKALLNEFAEDGRPILIVTDAWKFQTSGVVTVMDVMERKVKELTGGKVKVHWVTADQVPGLYVPYQRLLMPLPIFGKQHIAQVIKDVDPQAVHVMVEGNLGKAAKKVLEKQGIPYTTAYHSEFPDFIGDLVEQKTGSKWLGDASRKLTTWDLRKFHRNAGAVMAPTLSLGKSLVEKRGFDPASIRNWSHGVETNLFEPSLRDPEKVYPGIKGPISLYVGRMAVEKNLEDYLKMNVPGTKVLIGDGPEIETLRKKYPDAVFLGRRNYTDLPKYYASADMFVFTSLTDTFGLVQLEAMASGTPVVGYKVQGPVDVITSPDAGAMADYDAKDPQGNIQRMEQAWHQAIGLDRGKVRQFAEANTWDKSMIEFFHFLKRMPKATQSAEGKP